jgi:hypothetical protein
MRNANSRELARLVRNYIHPDTPGGVSYAAQRLARTEINNAFHTTSLRHYNEQPWVEGVKWSLSSSHPHADACDEYATEVHFRGGEPGVYKPEDTPSKPHPQCFCYVSPVTMSDEAFIRAFNAGEFDAAADQLIA